MIRGTGLDRRAVIASVALACALLLLTPLAAFGLPPHVATSPAPDTCAMCHRAHTASASFGVVDTSSWEMTRSALAVAFPSDAGDTVLCYVCHGVDALGSGTPVGASFEETSAHSLAPAASPWGPSVKYCSSCHDSHGTDESAPGVPYARLLRARTSAGLFVFQGSSYCGTCHAARPLSRFDGVAVYEQTMHYLAMSDPANGTKIRCTVCHVGHGSSIAPLITSQITSPSVPATETITANDRTFCLACHPDTSGTYPGETTYTVSAHAYSSVLVTVTGEWAPDDAKRKVGECQVCHAPMGVNDGTGAPIPSLLEVDTSVLCLSCHDADGVATTDLASLAYPASAATQLELVAGFSPETTTAAFGTVAVWGTDVADSAPRDIVGPRFYAPAGFTGQIAVGDIDGAEGGDVLVADPTDDTLTVFIQNPLKGLTSYFGPGAETPLVGVTADFLAVADVLADPDDLPEVIVVDATAGDLYVLRWNILGANLDLIDGPIPVGSSPSGLATGDLTGGPFAEIVVTDAGGPDVWIFTESTVTSDTIATHATVGALAGVRGPSVGDIDEAAGIEIAVANADEAVNQVTVYDASLTPIDSYSVDATSGAKPQATLIANVLPGLDPGAELSVAVNGGADLSSVNVFGQLPGGGLAVPLRYDTGYGSSTGSLAAGDIDGDACAELIVGNGGLWSRDAALATAPSAQVFQHNGDQSAFASNQVLRAGGVERAGASPSLAVADLGGVGPSRHPVGAAEDAHVSTETPAFERHVECADCHNVHETTSTVAAAPNVYGRIAGTFGASVTNTGAGTSIAYDDEQPVRYEYETCFKCHSAYAGAAGLQGAADIAAEVNAENASVHAVEEAVTAVARTDSFVAPWDNDTQLYCIDCHTIAGAAPAVAGPHASSEAPVLKSPYLGVVPSNSAGLCYDCHKYTVYYTSAEDTGTAASWFYDPLVATPELHGLHVREQGFGCASCHESHGSPTRERLVRPAITYTPDASGGTCIGPCHPLGITYVR